MSLRWRLLAINLGFILSVFLLLGRLFYWQVLASEELTQIAQSQQTTVLESKPKRGEILASDGSYLVANQPAHFAYLTKAADEQWPGQDLIEKIAPYLYSSLTFTATPSGLLTSSDKEILIKQTEEILVDRLSDNQLRWVPLANKLSDTKTDALKNLNISNLGFSEDQIRYYPEASMSANLLGFVGQDIEGRDVGYNGLEGYYQNELTGRSGVVRQEKDAFNQPIIMGNYLQQQRIDGKTLQLYLDKSLQFMVEKKLRKAIDQFGAKSGSVVIMDPFTGGILAMASLPTYDPAEYGKYDRELFLNPVVSDAFEPGSIFKVIVMAAGLDSKVIQVDTKCDICDKAYKIDKYTIKTWNDKYQANSSMTDILVHSDNVGMVFIGQKLGKDKFLDYFKKFGFTQETGIDLQGELAPQVKPESKWSYVDLATASFGQGFVATSMQLLQAVSVIANGGNLVEPHVVKKIITPNRQIDLPIKIKHKVISQESAQEVTQMMLAAAKEGEAKWASTKGYQVAGKTGTAQVAVEGKYDDVKTNASFIGFAPANDPKFTMLVTLKEPSSSQWASETAAPLWFSISQDLFNHFNVIPNSNY